MSKSKNRVGVVYSTNPNYQYEYEDEIVVPDTLPVEKQKLRVSLDKHARGGKVVTLISGFVGSYDDLDDLCKKLKNKCAVGGVVKDSEILLQGDQREKVVRWLLEWGYQAK